MMEFISIPAVIGICIYGFYKVIEVFARRKERLLLIEKLSEIKSSESVALPSLQGDTNMGRFMALRAGALLAGLGLGLLVGYIIFTCTMPDNFGAVRNDAYYSYRDMMGVVYGASTLLFGGIALLSAFVVEWKMSKK